MGQDNKGIISYLWLEMKGAIAGAILGVVVMLILYYLSSTGTLPFTMPFGAAPAPAGR
ncbi:MAG: hypothetical protein HYS81_04655 [Candidatus Aenigmatarchaeota archaeon]|nr:MAG: hypothetical protein HYS81_04655 [Candidatus Aenigmarchaeota archaeon]